MFEVGGVEVDLVGGQGADELLLELERGDGAAGEIVVEAADFMAGQSRMVAVWSCGVGAVAGDELLHGLQGVEDSGAGGGGEGEAFVVGDDGVAFGFHGFGHGCVGGAGGQCGGVDGVGERCAVADDEDVDGRCGVDGDALGGE